MYAKTVAELREELRLAIEEGGIEFVAHEYGLEDQELTEYELVEIALGMELEMMGK